MKVLITGVTGFVGKHLTNLLLNEKSWEISGAGRGAAGSFQGKYFQGDLSRYEFTASVLSECKPDMVFHMAGLVPGIKENFEDEMIKANLTSSLNLLEAVDRFSPTARVLMMGTAAEYGPVQEHENPVSEEYSCRPTGHYALSKYWMSLAAMDYHARKNMNVIIARSFNLIGPGISSDNVAGAFLARANAALKNSGIQTVKMGNLSAVRDYMDVRDLCHVLIQLIEQGRGGQVYNIGSGAGVKTSAIIEKLASCYEGRVVVESDAGITQKKIDVPVVVADITKLNRTLSFQPKYSLDESIYDTYKAALG